MAASRQSPTEDWSATLENAAKRFDGGPRSFPPSSDVDVACAYRYEPPNTKYEKLFWSHASIQSPQRRQRAPVHPHSAGWLMPDPDEDNITCSPVFVAHSLLSAIWLLRKTLPCDALPDAAWECMVHAAQRLHGVSGTLEDPPPSAQQPRNDPLQGGSKRTASPRPLEGAKRLRNQSTGSSHHSNPDDEEERVEEVSIPPIDAADLRTTVTNSNRHAEQTRAKKLKANRAKQKRNLGLLAPLEGASREEHSAYMSIKQRDEPLIAWIIKQPVEPGGDVYGSAREPYNTSLGMLRRARAIGNEDAKLEARAFIHSWRSNGMPFTQDASEPRTPTSTQGGRRLLQWVGNAEAPQTVFAMACRACDVYEQELSILHIKYRWAMAFIGQNYAEKIEEMQQRKRESRTQNGGGKTRTEVISALMREASIEPTKANRERFRKRLHRAKRWHEAVKTLGWGILCLMPHDYISTSWVEKELRIGEWHVWLQLVIKVNPDAFEASQGLDRWLGSQAVSPGPIKDKAQLYIESVSILTRPGQAEEVRDSDDEDGVEEGGEDSDVEPAHTQASADALALRELTLLELCMPISTSTDS